MHPDDEQQPNEPLETGAGSRRRKPVVLLAGVVLTVACGWLWWARTHRAESGHRIPEVSLEGVHPTIATAIRDAQGVVQDRPESGWTWGRLGMVLKAHEFQMEAVECLRVASQLDKSDARWPYLLGDTLAHSQPDSAAVAFRDSASRKPRDPLPLVRLSRIRLNQGRIDDAIEVLHTAEKREPGNARLAYLFARCYLARGDLKPALAWARKARRRSPGVRLVHELCAQIEARLNKIAEARESLRAVRENPRLQQEWVDPYLLEVLSLRGDPRWAAFRVQQLLEAGHVRAGLDVLVRATKQHPDSVMLTALLAQTLIKVQDYTAADEILRESLREKPNALALLTLRGTLFLLRQDWQQAVTDFARVAAAHPNDSRVLSDLGFCLKQLGKIPEAIAALETALRIDPQLVPARLQLATIHLEQGRFSQADTHIRKALQADPGNKKAVALLARIPK